MGALKNKYMEQVEDQTYEEQLEAEAFYDVYQRLRILSFWDKCKMLFIRGRWVKVDESSLFIKWKDGNAYVYEEKS